MIEQDGGSRPCRPATRSGPGASSRASANNNEEEKKWARLTTHTSKVTYRCYFPVLTELVLRRHTGPDPPYQGKISSRDEKVRGFHGGSPTNAGGDERDRTADLFVANEALSQLSYTPTKPNWRRGRDSNPGNIEMLNGFRDRPVQPLRHLSKIYLRQWPFAILDDRVAEREGFEPSVPCGTHDFQSCRLSHSRTSPPESRGQYSIRNCQNQRPDGENRDRSAVTTAGKKRAQQGPAFRGHDPPDHLDPVFVGITVQKPGRADDTTGAGIARAKNQTADP